MQSVDRTVTWEEGPAPAGPIRNPWLVSPRYFVREDPGSFTGPSKVRGSSECLECGLRTTHMKRHVVQYHIANHFWQIIPMMVCWLCRQFETPAVIKQHSGMFVMEDHVGEFVRGVNSFFQFLYSEMVISSRRSSYVMCGPTRSWCPHRLFHPPRSRRWTLTTARLKHPICQFGPPSPLRGCRLFYTGGPFIIYFCAVTYPVCP